VNSRQKAAFVLAKVQQKACEIGAVVAVPLTEGQRYDCLLDWKGLHRVQLKYCGVAANGVVKVKLTTGNGRTASRRSYSSEEVDAVVGYVPSVNQLIWIPAKLFDGKTSIYLRTTPTRNGQKKGCVELGSLVW